MRTCCNIRSFTVSYMLNEIIMGCKSLCLFSTMSLMALYNGMGTISPKSHVPNSHFPRNMRINEWKYPQKTELIDWVTSIYD